MKPIALCVVCQKRPRPKQGIRLTCWPCAQTQQQVAGEDKARRRAGAHKFDRFYIVIAWKDDYLGVEIVHDDNVLVPCRERHIYLGVGLKGVPKDKLVNLDVWQPDYTAAQVKRMKNAIRRHSPFWNLKTTRVR